MHDTAAGRTTAPLKTMAGRALALFIGSAHMPNVEAVKFLCSSVARRVPEVTFGIVGAVCDAVRLLPKPPNVMLFGALPEAEKNLLLASATFAVNPMLQGGGSSLKIPDFFAARLPVVSTRIGARGYDLVDGKHYVAADGDEFASATRLLAQDSALRGRLARNARQVAEDALDWRVLGARYRRALRSLVAPDAKPRALVVTYRFADPPPGGAETFLVNVLRELAKRGNLAIDVATCDVGAIANKWHFSGDYSLPVHANADPAYVGRVLRFPVDAPQEGDFERCRRLFAVWMAESRKQPALLRIELPEPLLLGGWNFPEIVAGKASRWASGEAQVRVGARASALHVSGYAPTKAADRGVAGRRAGRVPCREREVRLFVRSPGRRSGRRPQDSAAIAHRRRPARARFRRRRDVGRPRRRDASCRPGAGLWNYRAQALAGAVGQVAHCTDRPARQQRRRPVRPGARTPFRRHAPMARGKRRGLRRRSCPGRSVFDACHGDRPRGAPRRAGRAPAALSHGGSLLSLADILRNVQARSVRDRCAFASPRRCSST